MMLDISEYSNRLATQCGLNHQTMRILLGKNLTNLLTRFNVTLLNKTQRERIILFY